MTSADTPGAERPAPTSRGTVRVRMTLATTVVVGAAMAASAWLLVTSVRTSLEEDQRAESTLAVAQAQDTLNRVGDPTKLPPAAVQGFTIVVLDTDGRVVGGSPGYQSGTWEDFLGRDRDHRIIDSAGRPFPEAIAGERHVWFVHGRIFDATPVIINGREPGFLVVAGPVGAIERSVRTLARVLWWAGPILVLLSGIVAWRLTGRALRPVEAIRQEVTNITATSLDRRVPEPRADDEVGRLARTMNEMLDRLEDSSDRQRRFVSDASHELRSPVAAIRATGEVALAHPDQADWPTVMRQVLREDDRMERIVGDLLDLARGEEPALPSTVVDLDDLVIEEVTRARRADRTIQTTGVSGGRVRGSREQLTRVVRNLLDNGLRHATHTVAITVGAAGDTVTLTVTDDGPGIAPPDRDRVFERFTRLDEGRARDAGGLGLGLAMVRTIAERHGGTATITDPEPGGLPGARLVVELPAAD